MATRTQRLIVFVLVAIPAAAVVAYMHFAGEAAAGKPNLLFPEKAEVLAFEPAPASLADRTRFELQKDAGYDVISTTLPVSATVAEVPMANIPVLLPSNPDGSVASLEGDADIVVGTAEGVGAYIIRYENAQICKGDVCPMVLAVRKKGAEQIDSVLFSAEARNMWVSNVRKNGNPDLIVDYGNPDMSPIRMYWDESGQFPGYMSENPYTAGPLPQLPEAK